MFLLTPNDFAGSVLYNNRISNIDNYIRDAELSFWYDLCPFFAKVLESAAPNSVFVSLINDPIYFPIRYRDYMPFFVYNYLRMQGILVSGDVKEENYENVLFSRGIFGLRRIYDYMFKVFNMHSVLFFDSSLGYCLFDEKIGEHLCPPPVEGTEYVDFLGNVYRVTSVSSAHPFQVYISPVPSSDIYIGIRFNCEQKKFVFI